MAKALIFLAAGYEEVEMLTVVDMLRRAGIDIDMVSITKDLEVTGSHNITIKADVLFEDADLDQAQALSFRAVFREHQISKHMHRFAKH